ncbi:tRNA methylthiotransferase YqeV [Catonella morbi ATCC 51271]|uniref:Threonylcarbamoyladenosine tRNA methylthiotransferase MtaB n=1 Tax=Catonella morbi ATCC 51271 TaxID=592026 RepID=V2ZBS4_9FIRM|nr:tRNA methylthiotransferase YqeV [Catonella morbi ATCC 51271]
MAFLTLGCKVNAYETESIKEMFKNNGYEIKQFNEVADIYIVNTCTVTNIADRKSRQMLHRAKKLNPEAVVVAVGCYVQAPQSKLEDDDLVDILVGTRGKSSVLSLVEEYIRSNKTRDFKHNVIKSGEENKDWAYDSGEVNAGGGKNRANIKIQDGCDQFCTYCIIPFVRGRIRSRDMEGIVEETDRLVKAGFREMVLTGIHIGSYGRDIDGESRMLELLTELNKVEGDFRIRLGSVEPRLITEEFLEGLVKLKKVCPHFHLSLQSGSTTVLKRMNRHYGAEEYLNSVKLLKKYYDRPGITTDIIVGFPGETDEEFEETVAFVKEVGFLKVHVFPYSKRDGTYAAKMNEQIAPEIKKERENILIKVCEEVSEKYLESFNGDMEQVLLEEEIKGREDYVMAHSARYIEVAVPKMILSGRENADKEFLNVKGMMLSDTSDGALKGMMIAREI